MSRALILVGALLGAVIFSQSPAFTQQYLQRLAGQVDALAVVVMDFDRSALQSGLGREEALRQMQGTAFLDARQQDMRVTFDRHARLALNLAELRAASPLVRLSMPHRFTDPEIFNATLSDFEPALPMSFAGAVAAAAGALSGWAIMRSLISVLSWALRRMSRPIPPVQFDRKEPVLRRTQT